MDKKSCDTCNGLQKCFAGYLPGKQTVKDKTNCPNWLRDPYKWLDILPEEPAYYWYIKNGDENGILYVDKSMLEDFQREGNNYAKTFKWQGPIKPSED